MNSTSLTPAEIVARADDLLPKFRAVISEIPPEAGFGGIWESEMLLFYAAVQPCAPRQVLESGRARGKSTLMLARAFPAARIISVEFDRDSPNAPAAAEKLKPYANVELLYGDSREVLPDRLQPGDAVLIDGPKGFRALELALQLLATNKPCAVFIHDFPPGVLWRKFVEKYWPAAFFGDNVSFQGFRVLDEQRDPRSERNRGEYGIFVCLPPPLPRPQWQLKCRLFLTRLLGRVV